MSRSADGSHRGPAVVLAPGRERSVTHRHPWIFAGAIESVRGNPSMGDTVIVAAAGGEPLAVAAYSPSSQIRARVWSFDPGSTVDATFIAHRISHAAAMRAPMFDARHNAARLVNGESDGLPGIVADRYGDVIVMQLTSAGAERWRDAIVAALMGIPGVACVYERSDAEVRSLEGLPSRTGAAAGTLPRDPAIVEDGIAYGVDPVGGQKTGFYLDQRENRRLVRSLARARRVLNVFCYTGGFTLAALAGGAARATSIDSSEDAIAQGRANLARNASIAGMSSEWIAADAFAELRRLRNAGATFDLIVLDPPKFAPTAAHAQRAARAYKDVNLLALKMLEPGGLLATFSCSGGVSPELFSKIVAGAAVDAKADVQVMRKLGASADHPVGLAFPEGEYLKGLLLRKV
ncbi:MAG: class I SAM-dependent rRNA methyltransferase [Burkholderiales bacterium]